jgi:hypothetical protein
VERKSILTIASWLIAARGKVERSDMRACEELFKRLWCIAIVGWTVHAALPHESGPSAPADPAALSGVQQPGSSMPECPNPADLKRPATATPPSTASICTMVEDAAQSHGLPLDFFARLIWQESRFNPGAIGPVTRNGQRAQGIAQFMPETAKERGVADPFDPSAALPKSAEFLRELRTQFGNLGLAAAAYNAGPKRVRDWLSGRTSLPGQTRTYVSTITGRSAAEWAKHHDETRSNASPERRTSCTDLVALLKADRVLYADAIPWPAREYAEL